MLFRFDLSGKFIRCLYKMANYSDFLIQFFACQSEILETKNATDMDKNSRKYNASSSKSTPSVAYPRI
jgi:hypothetical protein